LTPPGPPGPTMVTLSQIEPRTPISSVPFIITQPGSYYLTTNVTVSSGSAITIATNNVTLDLNGFTIFSTSPTPSGYAVLLSGAVVNACVHNGNISSGVTNNSSGVFSGTGFNYGISESTADPINARVKDVSVTGVQYYGIYLGANATVVESCAVNEAGAYGIAARSVSDSTVLNCGIVGINGGSINNCYCSGVGSGWGISGVSVNNCSATSAAGSGAYTIYAQNAQNCYGYDTSTGDGIHVINTALNCNGYSSSGTGLYAGVAMSCAGSSGGGIGISSVNTAQNCYGYSTSMYSDGLDGNVVQGCYGSCTGVAYGIRATTVLNSSGNSSEGNGIFAQTVENSYGNGGIYGIYAEFVGIGCIGNVNSGGIAGLFIYIANSCYSGTGDSYITYKYNMP